jgi:5-methylcytosine-specific restriction protein B
VLIIDEINRGNVSQIFGELITLLEEDKRMSNTESLEVVLPYSKEAFSVPPNLFVLGTMNTADRSVEALDTALRRRFSFVEMPPMPELLTPEMTLQRLWKKYEQLTWEDKKWLEAEGDFLELYEGEILIQKEYRALENRNNLNIPEKDFKDIVSFTGLSLEKLLRVLNLRIEKLLDKDHQIGHSYLMNVFSIEELKQAFSKNIIPLLQEYFYGDYGKIGMILGEAFFEINTEEDVAFKPFFEYPGDELSEKPIYRLRNLDNMENGFLNAVKSIME